MSVIEEPNPDAPPGEEDGEEKEPPEPIVHEVCELQRLRVIVESVSAATSVLPKVIINAISGGFVIHSRLEFTAIMYVVCRILVMRI